MKIVFTRDNESYLYKEQDVHNKYGVVRKEVIDKAKPGTVIQSNTGKEMIVSETNFLDLYRRIRRNAQIILPKDIAAIIAETGINKNSKVFEAGAGSGALSCYLAHFVKKVYSYEIREDFIENTIKKNIEMFKYKNIVLKKQDVYLGIDEKNFDCVIFDLPEPWRAIESGIKALKHGGYLVNYSPNITQTKQFVESVLDNRSMLYQSTVEIIERAWEIDKMRARPKFQMLGHTGFLSFARKL
jgi:tRNA (adenine57-N1/adenine58-N1)-methyltransferase catalytic subunit